MNKFFDGFTPLFPEYKHTNQVGIIGMAPHKHPGVYQIVNTINGKSYVGSSVNMDHRWKQHAYLLRGNRHFNKHLQSAFNLYGESAFVVRPLCVADRDDLILFEQMLVDGIDPEYNIGKRVDRPTMGVEKSAETRQRISESKKGKSLNIPSELRQKMSNRMLGNRQGVGVTNRRGVVLSEETKEKIREARKHQVITKEEAERHGISMRITCALKPNNRSKLSIQDCRDIVDRRSRGEKCLDLADEYGVGREAIFNAPKRLRAFDELVEAGYVTQ